MLHEYKILIHAKYKALIVKLFKVIPNDTYIESFMIVLCFSSEAVIAPTKPPAEALSCDANKPGIVRIWFCKHRECHRKCFAKYGSAGIKNPHCQGRDTCVCCNDN